MSLVNRMMWLHRSVDSKKSVRVEMEIAVIANGNLSMKSSFILPNSPTFSFSPVQQRRIQILLMQIPAASHN